MFRELARVAVATSFSVAAASCTRYQIEGELPEVTGGMGGTGGQSGEGGTGGIAGTGGIGGSGGAGSGGFGGTGGSTGGSGGSVGGSGGSVGGSGGFTGGTGGSDPGGMWTPIACNPNTLLPELINPATLQRPIDFAAFYRVWLSSWDPWLDDAGVGEPSGTVHEQILFGTACGNANDWQTCQQSLEALKPTVDSCLSGDACRVLLTTEGDALMRIEERAALVALLGPIDTGEEAGLAAWLSGTDVACAQDFVDPPLGTRTRPVPGGIEVETRVDDCSSPYVRRERVRPDGTIDFVSQTDTAPTCAIGRRPEGLQNVAPHAVSELGAYFASAAHLEAASVHAFARFAQELHTLGAPEALVGDAWRAALEEIAHTRMVGLIAEHFGGEVPVPCIEAPPARDAFAIALENAVEGCVRETYGALVAWYQSETATDPMVKRAMAQIAEDETRHAELSWRVAEWLEPQLSELEQAQIATARRDAFVVLREELAAAGLSEAAARMIGLPDQEGGIALLNQLGQALSLQA